MEVTVPALKVKWPRFVVVKLMVAVRSVAAIETDWTRVEVDLGSRQRQVAVELGSRFDAIAEVSEAY